MNHRFIWFLFLETDNSFKLTKTENSAKALYQTETVFENNLFSENIKLLPKTLLL